MAKKLFNILRSNWKKTVFFSGVSVYGINYGKQTYEDSVLRSVYCREAKIIGEEPLNASKKARRVTVFLNPAANKGKGKKIFEKNVAPLLYLAGLEVTVIKTEYEGQAKKYMSVIDDKDTDAIIVAGGDGTLLEVVTGLLRRDEQEKVSSIPVGVIPIGKTNQFANRLFKKDPEKSDVWWLSENVMSIVRNCTKAVDVMHIQGEKDKSVYAVSGIDWGLFRDTHLKKKEYWYLGPLRDKWTYFRTTVGKWPHTVRAKLTYSHPCDGCSRCVTPPPPAQWKWWHLFISPKIQVPEVDYSKVNNEQCGNTYSRDFTGTEISCSCNKTEAATNMKEPLLIRLVPETLSKYEFMKEGFERSKNIETELGENIKTNKFTLHPQLKEDESWFSIDSEDFEAMSIDVQLLRNKINIFCPTVS